MKNDNSKHIVVMNEEEFIFDTNGALDAMFEESAREREESEKLDAMRKANVEYINHRESVLRAHQLTYAQLTRTIEDLQQEVYAYKRRYGIGW